VLPTWPAVRCSAFLCLALVTASGCDPGFRVAEEALLPYLTAVQAEDFDRLYCLSAGAAESEELGSDEKTRRAAFENWARSQYDVYLEGRDLGRIELDGHGIALVKMFALGKGTFYSVAETRATGDGAMRIRTDLRFGYGQLDLSRLSPGTTFYLCGTPVGRVHPVRVPSIPREVSLEVLESVSVEWTLVRGGGSGSCAPEWQVASAVPVEGSAHAKRITWVF